MKVIPFTDPRAGFRAARTDLLAAVESVLDGGKYILSSEVDAFECEWCRRCGVPYAVGVSSGTDALALALRAVGVEPGCEVLVPAMTAIATWMAVSQIGALPIGVDIEDSHCGMDPQAAAGAIGPRTKALVAVHLFGHTADMAGLLSVARSAGIPTIEDAAQAHGARYEGRPVGSLASAAAFSFYPTKNLGTVGDAGAVTTTEPALAEQVRLLREYGWRTRADAEVLGVNARLDEVHAAMLRVMLTRFDVGTQRRRTIASAYLEGLADVSELELPTPRPKTESVWHLFVVRHPRRDAVAEALLRAGVGTGVHYDPPPHLTTAYRRFGWNAGDFPNAERHAATALTLPMHPFLTDSEVYRVIEAVRRACGAK